MLRVANIVNRGSRGVKGVKQHELDGKCWRRLVSFAVVYEPVREFESEIHKSLSLNNLRVLSLIKVDSLLARTYVGKRRILGQAPIPATHDTLTFNSTLAAQDQDLDVAGQLSVGIRWFDLRLVVVPIGPVLMGEHGGIILGTEFGENVLKPTIAFLNAYPTECVIYYITQNGTPSPLFSPLLMHYMNTLAPGRFYTTNVVPTLDKVAGRLSWARSTRPSQGLISAEPHMITPEPLRIRSP